MEPLAPDEALAVFDDAEIAHVGVISEGVPYVTPISFVIDGDVLRFRTGPGRRQQAIAAGSPVCVEAFTFGETGAWKSVVAWGTAVVEHDPDTGRATVEALHAKYERFMGDPLSAPSRGPMQEPVFVSISLDTVTGMSSGGGFGQRTRPGRL